MAIRRTKPPDGSHELPRSSDKAVEALDAVLGRPADELFKAMLRSRAEAVSVLESALPEQVAARIEWNTLEAVPTEQIDRWLDKRYSDLEFRVGLKDEGQTAFVNVRLEHQSRVERFMPSRAKPQANIDTASVGSRCPVQSGAPYRGGRGGSNDSERDG